VVSILATFAVACNKDSSSPTAPNIPIVSPATPETPATPTPPSPAPDVRRSFIWSEDKGYTILENPTGVALVSAEAINDRGEVAGTMLVPASASSWATKAFRWSPAGGYSYPPTPANISSSATGLDDNGDLVGYLGTDRAKYSVLWNGSKDYTPLNVALPYLAELGVKSGWVFGNAITGNSSAAPFRQNLSSGKFEQLPTVSAEGGGVLSINSLGEAGGFDGIINYGFGGTSDAVVWDASGSLTVAFPCHGVQDCFANIKAINSDGFGVGTVQLNETAPVKSFRWSRSKGAEFLTDAAGKSDGVDVAGLTDDGRVLAFTPTSAFIVKADGATTPLPVPPGFKYVQPRGISRNGQVVGMLF
jgi:hypothetical protein